VFFSEKIINNHEIRFTVNLKDWIIFWWSYWIW